MNNHDVPQLTLGDLCQALAPQATWTVPADAATPVTSVVIDSRQAMPGALFVAFVGESTDGHQYVAEAFARGAVAAVVEKAVDAPGSHWVATQVGEIPAVAGPFCLQVENSLVALQSLARYWRQRFPVRVVGITGSVGKTTTKELVHTVLSQRFTTLKSSGNYNNEIGLPLTLLNLRQAHERAVLEMGMYTLGEIALLCELAQPEVGIVTNIGAVHMSRVGTQEAIVAAKQELVAALPPAPTGVAILNLDEPLVMGMAEATEARIFTYGLQPEADLWADEIQSMGLEGIRFNLHYGSESLHIHVPLLGRHSVHTSLRAAAVGLVEGMGWEEIVSGLQENRDQLRLVAMTGPADSIIIDDTYNSSPESAIAALNLLSDLDGRRIAVLGDMLELGPVAEASHRLVGRRARDVAHILVAVGEMGRWIGEEALFVGMDPTQVLLVDTPAEAAAQLEKMVTAQDVILVKGSHGAHLDHIVSVLGRDI